MKSIIRQALSWEAQASLHVSIVLLFSDLIFSVGFGCDTGLWTYTGSTSTQIGETGEPAGRELVMR